MKNLLFLSAVACCLALFIFLIYNVPLFSQTIFGLLPTQKTANPAAEFCQNQGGERIIKKGQTGENFVFCRFQDGSVCEEWALYRGTCQKIETGD